MAEKMSEENYAFKATADVRTFGQLIGHVADSQARTCGLLNGEPKNLNASTKTAKAELVAALQESFAVCDKAIDSMTDAKAAEMITLGQRQSTRVGVLARLIAHSNEEYGYMAVYALERRNTAVQRKIKVSGFLPELKLAASQSTRTSL